MKRVQYVNYLDEISKNTKALILEIITCPKLTLDQQEKIYCRLQVYAQSDFILLPLQLTKLRFSNKLMII